VDTMYFSGAYSYRTSRVGKLSLHAYGLALDVHEFVVKNQRLNVREHFARGLGDACAPESPKLNQIACRLKATGLFRELLTPDYNADHADHMHIGLPPLTNERPIPPGEAPLRTAAAKPAPAKAKHPAKPSVKLPALDPVDPGRDEPIVIPDPEPKEKPKAQGEKTAKREKPLKKRRANARAKSAPKRFGKKA